MKVNVYLKDMDNFASMNEVYEKVGTCVIKGLRLISPIATSNPKTRKDLHPSSQIAK